MKLSHIRDVLAVAELGSLRKAGRHVGIAQPAITRSIQELEHELGAPLFERHAKGVRLTAIGEIFVRRASIVETELRRARDEIEQVKGFSTGQVTVAMSIAPSIALMPAAIAAFRKRYPEALLRVSETLFQPVEQDVTDGRIDFYVGALEVANVSPRLSVETLFANQRVVVARKGHKLASTGDIAALSAACWLRPALSSRSSEADFEGWLRSIGVAEPKIVVHTRSALQTVLAVASSDLLTVVPKQWLELPALNESLDALSSIKPIEAAPVCLVRQTGAPLTPMAEHLCDLLRRLAANYERRTLLKLGAPQGFHTNRDKPDEMLIQSPILTGNS